MRREIPVLITFIVGVIVMLAPVIGGPIPGTSVTFQDIYGDHISPWMTIVSAFAIGLAAVNLGRVHMTRVMRKRQEWIYSAILMVSMIFFTVFRSWVELDLSNKALAATYQTVYSNIITPLSTGIWTLLAFYVASASYRAFRARSAEATVLLVSAVLVMLGAAPIGAQIWSKFPVIQTWLLNVPNMVGQRGLMIGAAIGGFVTSLRILVGIERGHLGGSGE